MTAFGVVALASTAISDAFELPDFSWDTLPVAWHSALSGELEGADLETLARYPFVTLEKSAGSHVFNWPHGLPLTCQNGTDLSACGCCEEDNMIRQARALKKVNPRTQVIAYMNSIISYPWYRAAHKHVSNSSWWLRDVNGSLLNNIQENPTETWYTWDFSKPEVGDLWMEACKNMTDSGVIDGCFMDGCANWDRTGRVDGKLTVPGPLRQDVHDAYARNKPAWMRRLQQQVPGVMICGSNGGFLDGVAATQVQNWGVHDQDYAGHWIPMLQRAVSAGKVFQAHAACGSGDPFDPIEQTKLAAFLVAAGEHSYYMCGGWGAATVDWYPVYDMPLGKPLGNATLDANGIYLRRFAAGTVVTFDTKRNNGTIHWASAPTPPPTPAVQSQCPASHPWAYRPQANFDYCCASADDKFGNVGVNARKDRSARANSCKDDAYVPCVAKPCDDYIALSLLV